VEDWDKSFDVNGKGVFLCYKYAAQQMIQQGRGGRIIGACSQAGKQGEYFLSNDYVNLTVTKDSLRI
jgi:NAD(P)-dependent dehydrogenase (short-subunit alcohol dehydrogenase family)